MNEKIIPAIMPANFDEMRTMAELVRSQVQTIQLDIMDGKYVPEKTWPFFFKHDRDLENLMKQEISLPYWEEVNYELDLMIERPEEDLEVWLGIGAARVIFHYASVHDWQPLENIDQVSRNFVKIGCAVTVHDDVENIYPLIENKTVDFVQVMGIANIGYQGEPFDERALDIIEKFHSRYKDLLVTVDGGVSINSIGDLAKAGADEFVSGSAVFGGGIVSENIQALREGIQE